MVTAADTNNFLDLLTSNSFARDAEQALRRAAVEGRVIISVVAYAELAHYFDRMVELDEFLTRLAVTVPPIDPPIAFRAGQFHREYRLRGGTRTRILADFLIAAHTQLRADRLLTRDQRFFSEHFPSLAAVHPQDL